MIENVIDAQDYIYDRFQQESLAGKNAKTEEIIIVLFFLHMNIVCNISQ